MSDKIQTRFWGRQIDDVMSEIVRQAAICQVKLLDPGVSPTNPPQAGPPSRPPRRSLRRSRMAVINASVSAGPIFSTALSRIMRPIINNSLSFLKDLGLLLPQTEGLS